MLFFVLVLLTCFPLLASDGTRSTTTTITSAASIYLANMTEDARATVYRTSEFRATIRSVRATAEARQVRYGIDTFVILVREAL